MGGSLAADRAGFIAAAIIDIAFAVLALDRHDHSPLSGIARVPCRPLPFCRIEFTTVATGSRHPVVSRLAADRLGLADAVVAAGLMFERNALPN
jgi:hypothetical protein